MHHAPLRGSRRLAPLVALLFPISVTGCSCSDDESPSRSRDPDAGADAGPDAAPEAGTPDADTPDGGPEAGVDAGSFDLFDAWREMQGALRKSPDHLPARADALVAAADPATLFAFVRDEISTYPPATDGFSSMVYATRWGTRGTLRGGAGTPREKAELLASLYRRAGMEAEVMRGTPDTTRLDGQGLLFRPVTRTYAPVATATQVAAWHAALGHDPLPTRTLIDADGPEADALTTSLLGVLPTTLSSPFDFTLEPIPLVRVRVNGQWQFANPIAPGAAFGDPVTTADPTGLSDVPEPPPIYVKLEAARASAPFARFTLVEREYAIDDVVGRRIHIAFPPPLDTAALVRSSPEAMQTLVPVLSVASPELSQADRDRLAVVGNPVSLGGDVFELSPTGTVIVNGVTLAEPTTDPALVESVATVEADVEPAAFPQITLRVSAEDAAGAGVPRLGASAFTLMEDGQPVSFTLQRNEAPPPRIVLLFDSSTSLPPEFRGAGAVTIGRSLVSALYSAHPDAEVRVGTIFFGASWMSGAWAGNLADAGTQVDALATATGGSEIWAALADAQAEKPTLIVLVTDADATEALEPRQRDAIAAGAPVLTLGAGTVVQATLDEIAALSGGTSVAVADGPAAVAAAAASIEASDAEDYVITYRAPTPGSSGEMRTVSVEVNGHTDTATYAVPAVPTTPPALSGLYLTLRVGNRESTRSIAGLSSSYTTGHVPVTQAMLDDVHATLLGRISIAVEGAAPSAAVVMDDWIAEKLTLEPLWNATQAGDEAAVLEALHEGVVRTPGKLPLSQPPLPGAIRSDSLTFETSPRVATFVQKVNDGGPVTRQLDLFPLSRWATAAEDPRTAFERTLRATASLAVVESGLMSGTSTLEALAGVPLTLVPAGAAGDQSGLTDEQRLVWGALEDGFPRGTSLHVPFLPGPFWAIDDATGTVVGMLGDGTGGGAEDACSTYDQANAYIQLMSLLGSFFGVSMGGWTALAQWEVKYVTIATIVIGGGALPGGGVDLTNPAADMACGAFDDALGDRVPGLGTYEAIVGTAETAGGDTGLPTVCGGGSDGLCQ